MTSDWHGNYVAKVLPADVRAVVDRTAELFPEGTMSKLREHIDAVEAEREALYSVLSEELPGYDQEVAALKAERDELQRQVEAARSALEEITTCGPKRFPSPDLAATEMLRLARAALAPQTGEVGP